MVWANIRSWTVGTTNSDDDLLDAELLDLDDLIFQNDALMYEFPGEAPPVVPHRRSSLFVPPLTPTSPTMNANANANYGALPRRRSSLLPPHINTTMANGYASDMDPSVTVTTTTGVNGRRSVATADIRPTTPTTPNTAHNKLVAGVALLGLSKHAPPRRSSSLPPTPQEPDGAIYSRLFGQECERDIPEYTPIQF
ncbi:hypothetical protein BDF19DRAFT_153920 [Syncephalis fuscata]|nr:hypothetical protein BDF19DRAFT_153920 [Syncephalis fuscata]